MLPPFTILALGDSLTEGYGLPAGCAVPDVLRQLLEKSGTRVRIVNLGLSGDTTAGGLRRLRAWLSRHPAPHAAMVELGVNDTFMGLEYEEIEDNLDAILQILTAQDVPVLLTSMPLLFPAHEEDRKAFDAIYSNLAARHRVMLHPFFPEGVAANPALSLPDGIHPAPAGAHAIAEHLLPAIQKLLCNAAGRA